MSVLTEDQVRGYAAVVGFSGTDLLIAAAVAMAESGGDTQATGDIDNPVQGASSRGLWQINTHYWPQFDPAQLYDPVYNATAARTVQQAQGWNAWSTYNSGAYRQFLGVHLHLPLVNQLAGGANYRPPSDGAPDNNPNYNCGEADFCSIVSHFGGPTLDPDEVKDAVLGPGATNEPSAMDAYAAEAKKYGIAITTVTNSDPATLLARIRSELAAEHPVVILIPSAWNVDPPVPQGVGSLHFVAMSADDGAGNLIAMNPWGAFYQQQSYAWWQARIRDGAIWVFSKVGDGSVGGVMLDINDPTVAEFFYLTPAGAWHCKQTGSEIAAGMLDTYRNIAAFGAAFAGLSVLGLPKSNIIYPTAGAGVQYFERAALVWDPGRKLDSPPGTDGDYYLAHVDQGAGQAYYSGPLATQLAQAQVAVKAAQVADTADKAAAAAAASADASDKTALATAETGLTAAKAQIDQLTAQVAQLQQQVADGKSGAAVVAAIRAALGMAA